MRVEVTSAVNFLVRLLRLSKGSHHISDQQLELFRAALVETLRLRYSEHWFPDRPCKGSGYRCIRINGKIDPVLAQAGEVAGLPGSYLHSLFPSELTMWIDPQEVSYRIGENGSICVLYDEREALLTMNDHLRASSVSPASSIASTTSNSSSSSSPSSSMSSSPDSSAESCKESMRVMDFLMDTRNILSFEQLTAFVSS